MSNAQDPQPYRIVDMKKENRIASSIMRIMTVPKMLGHQQLME